MATGTPVQIGPYQIIEEFGRGGMGVVYRAFDPGVHRPVAIKVLLPTAGAEDRLRFAREARAAGNLSHPCIVTIYHLGSEAGAPYIAMELIPGASIEKHMLPDQAWTVAKALSVIQQVAEALDFAHERDVVHRDIKPANILLQPDGRAKLTDFGIARIAAERITIPGKVIGTPVYMAPEQILGNTVDGKADQFSLVVIAYELLAGKRPFNGANLPALTYQIVHDDPAPLAAVNPRLASALDPVIRRALAKNPEGRFGLCVEFAAVLQSAALTKTIVVPTVRTGLKLRTGQTKVNPKDGLTYVWIEPGTFMMGCSPGDSEYFSYEIPPHRVTITRGFWIGQTPVTQAAYQRVMGTNPSHFKGPNRPVENVRWHDAQRYCKAVDLRLPTEAEWEYAARAGTTGSRYGDLDEIAWYSGNSGGETHDVMRKEPNKWGLYDMLGNIWEWTEDGWGNYAGNDQSDPLRSIDGQSRTQRGGSWDYDSRNARLSCRHYYVRSNSIGFRCLGS